MLPLASHLSASLPPVLPVLPHRWPGSQLEALLEDYWRLMPPYQGLPSLDGITPLR